MMRRLLASLFASLILAGCSVDSEIREVDWPEASPALWLIEDEDGRHGYMFGTIHALPDGVDWRTAAFDAALADADVILVEIADLDDSSKASAAFADVAYSDGLPPLLERVDPVDRDAVAALLRRAGAEESDFADMENWAAAMSLSGSVRIGDPENGVDRAIIDSGKRVEGLESFAEQFAIFDRLGEQDQTELLAAVARESSRENQVEAVKAWLSGDIEALARMGEEGIMGDPVLRNSLVSERNTEWGSRFGFLLGSGRTPFMAVGAGHLIGEDGMPALYELAGFTVTRLQ